MKPKKRFLSLLLCVTMLFSLCPQSVSAVGSVGTVRTHEHDENHGSFPETATPSEGTKDDSDAIQTATDSNGNSKSDADIRAIEKVRAMINALLDVSELEDMDEDELSEVHEKAQDAYDAFEALTEEQQAKLAEDLAKLRDLLEYLTGLVATAADAVEYIAYSWDGSKVVSETKSCTDYNTVARDSTTWNTGFYVVEGSVTFSDMITVNGTVNLILKDGASLNAQKGISVNSGKTLKIYGQSNGTGKLTATGYFSAGNGCAGIGGYRSSSGTIEIHGGVVTANGGANGNAGIGGCPSNSNGTVTIYNGTVTATGRGNSNGKSGGAGIGGGDNGTGVL